MTEKGKYPETWSEVFTNKFEMTDERISNIEERISKLESFESRIGIETLVKEYCDKRCLVMIPRETLIRLISM
jgi:hypothetical protein